MNLKSILLVAIVTSLAFGCFDEPRKIRLNGSTFDSIQMKISSFGFNINDTYRIYYKLEKSTWCIENYRAGTEKCNVRQQALTDGQGRGVGLLLFDNTKKELVVQQMNGNVPIDGAVLSVTNESDPLSVVYGYERYAVKAINADGSLLGQVKAANQRGTKGGLGEEELPEVDLTQRVVVSTGCGGSSDAGAGTTHKPAVTFEVDGETKHK